MSLTATDKQAPAFDEAIFFTERNFGGQGYLTKLGSRVDIHREYNSLNDRLLSVKVGSSCTVVAYRHAGFGTPSKQLTADTADINISGMSGFIVTSRTGEYPVAFSFKDELGEGRRMTLKSSEFPEGGENGVVQPNPEPLPGVDPATPRVFTVLRDRNDEAHPLVVAIYVRKASGEYEDIGAAMNIYWDAGSARIKDVLGWPTNLHHEQDGSTIHFVWR